MDKLPNIMTRDQAIELASGGDPSALAYLKVISEATRALDNLADQDKPASAYALGHLLLVQLPTNGFFQRHQTALISLHLLALSAWEHGDEMMRSADHREQAYAVVNRDMVNEIFIYVAIVNGVKGDQLLALRRAQAHHQKFELS
jgi:hypothetical protein